MLRQVIDFARDRRDREAVAAPRHGPDQSRSAIIKCNANVADASCQRFVRHRNARPDYRHNFFFPNQAVCVLDEVAKHFEALWPELDLAVPLAETAAAQVEGELVKVDLGDPLCRAFLQVSVSPNGGRISALFQSLRDGFSRQPDPHRRMLVQPRTAGLLAATADSWVVQTLRFSGVYLRAREDVQCRR